MTSLASLLFFLSLSATSQGRRDVSANTTPPHLRGSRHGKTKQWRLLSRVDTLALRQRLMLYDRTCCPCMPPVGQLASLRNSGTPSADFGFAGAFGPCRAAYGSHTSMAEEAVEVMVAAAPSKLTRTRRTYSDEGSHRGQYKMRNSTGSIDQHPHSHILNPNPPLTRAAYHGPSLRARI